MKKLSTLGGPQPLDRKPGSSLPDDIFKRMEPTGDFLETRNQFSVHDIRHRSVPRLFDVGIGPFDDVEGGDVCAFTRGPD
uniref:Uncharacterized protein n=1 Tax=Candidatus Kentrum sp. SD TaxID=2126332 RepID=A0A451BIW0_9GAMM|nr:MAG: hypothetical protein BECKSD772D_GA0070982_10103 [Candidatus Kentron sp. SD]